MKTIAIFCIFTLAYGLPLEEDLPDNVKVYSVSTENMPKTTMAMTKAPMVATEAPEVVDTLPPKPLRPDILTAAFVLANSPFNCNGLKDGHFADIHFGCEFFHQCHFFLKDDGQMYVQQAVFRCGTGTSFNQTMRTCDYTALVSCKINEIESIIGDQLMATTPKPGMSEFKGIPITNFKCEPSMKRQGFFYADMEAKCQYYHRCVYHVADDILYATQYSFMCPEGTIFNQETISCMAIDMVDCDKSALFYNSQAGLHPEYKGNVF